MIELSAYEHTKTNELKKHNSVEQSGLTKTVDQSVTQAVKQRSSGISLSPSDMLAAGCDDELAVHSLLLPD